MQRIFEFENGFIDLGFVDGAHCVGGDNFSHYVEVVISNIVRGCSQLS